ncbi:Uncharacterised protein [Actinomyces bovis]|uniref:Uncharacterized protein n=1 Tax=Actinomyces bovis TaxID=1658 RepID=A0ABY1VPP9_9ACTO|nr:hypothetical protein [Actinomyces bovis]SPT53038.1 Uncharacterised protein [Actinomyces bovis]VEG55318.1 Uncharacterised protein [Actinomyces israelii]
MRQFHRPARLNPELAESIEGAADIAATSELAHRTAQLLIGADAAPAPTNTASTTNPTPNNADHEPLAVTRAGVVAVASQGVDEVAELWADSPAGTLPGTLWRLFLLREWIRRDPKLVASRYATTIDLRNQPADSPALARLDAAICEAHRVPAPEQLRERIDALMRGEANGVQAVGPVCLLAAGFLRALAAGSQDTWIEDDADELADRVTRRDSALLATAAELADAARRVQVGALN